MRTRERRGDDGISAGQVCIILGYWMMLLTYSVVAARRGKWPNIPSILGGVISTNESIFGQVKSPLSNNTHTLSLSLSLPAEPEAGCQN